MTQYWPDVKYTETDPNYPSFWDHEWTKHGYIAIDCLLLSYCNF
jgi:hypothetical protein